MARYDDPNVPVSAVVGVIGAILLFVIIVALQALFYSMQEEELARKVYSRPNETLQRLDAEQLEQLSSYGWISEPEGVVHIPIERAMELYVEEQGR
jgi:FlaG/FlaF family flagellin (archaellin)